MQVDYAAHLRRAERIQLGSYYTPERLVKRVHELIRPFIDANRDKVVVLDSAGGCGAFLLDLQRSDYRIADRDATACRFLKRHFSEEKVFCTNSLVAVGREKFRIPSSAFLIVIGNPPYNDTTSEFECGRKGQNVCDSDLYDRDLGITFLRSYRKLRADVVCVLHPLPYLIKEANFRRLSHFREKYRLVKGEIFSSALFQGTGTRKFPILIALYEKHPFGMSLEYMRSFRFDVLDSSRTFTLSNYKTTDGYINKYPPRRNDIKASPIGLYYRSFRDLNSLKRNASFTLKRQANSIVVTLENFYQYAYLYCVRSLFDPPDVWLYGNLSPLVDVEDLERNKELYVYYTLRTNRVLAQLPSLILAKIARYYCIKVDHDTDMGRVEEAIRYRLSRLVE